MKSVLKAIALVGTVAILVLTLQECLLYAVAQFEWEDIHSE